MLDDIVNIEVIQGILLASGASIITFTTRSETVARWFGLVERLELFPMEEADGVGLILKIPEFSTPTADKDIRAMAKELHHEPGGLTLVFEQVASSDHKQWLRLEYLQLRTEKAKTSWIEDRTDGREGDHSTFVPAIQGVTNGGHASQAHLAS